MKAVEMRWRLLALILAINFSLPIYIFNKQWIVQMHGEFNSNGWRKVEADIISFEMQSMIVDKQKTHSYLSYRPKVTYQYFWNKTRFINDKVTWINSYDSKDKKSRSSMYNRGLYLKQAFSNRSKIDVYVNPKMPEQSVIYKDHSFKEYLSMITVSFIWFIPFFISIYLAISSNWSLFRSKHQDKKGLL